MEQMKYVGYNKDTKYVGYNKDIKYVGYNKDIDVCDIYRETPMFKVW